jgi:muconate cycloisomerase
MIAKISTFPQGRSSVIRRVRATPVRVPARPDSLNSEGVQDDDVQFALKFRTGKSWPDFPLEIKWIVQIETGDGTQGVGETYRAATRENISAALQRLLGLDVLRMNWRRMPTEDTKIIDALESAVLDLSGKLLDVPVCQILGGSCRDQVECMGWTGRRTPEDAARKAHEAMNRGHRVFKFKCSDKDPVRNWSEKIHERCGSGIQLLLDPNQRWNDVETTLRLMEGVDPAIMYGLEDPVVRTDYKAFRTLREKLGIPIFIHISLPYGRNLQRSEDLIPALREKASDGFNFNGPMFEFVRMAECATLDGQACWHGSEVDLGILEVSALHACAAAPGCTMPSDIFGELVREDDLIVEPIHFENGSALVPQGPGLGVELDLDAMEKFRAGESIVMEG